MTTFVGPPAEKRSAMPPLKFSVLMPVHNGAGVLAETLGTVLRQDYGNFEVVIADDASTDDLAAVLRRFPDPRLRVARFTQNVGYGANLERCRQRAAPDTDILVLMAQDDLLAKGYFRMIATVFQEHPEVGAITRPFYLFGGDLRQPIRDFPPFDRTADRVVSLADGEEVLRAIFGTVVQLSGLAFRARLVAIPFHAHTMPAHAYPFFHILRTHPVMFLHEYAVAVRRYTSQTRHVRAIYDVSPTQSWADMVCTAFPSPAFAEIRRRCLRIVGQNFVGLVQLKNFATTRILLREYVIMARTSWRNLLHPLFWAFVLGTLLVPRSLLLPLTDWYQETVLARRLRRTPIRFVPA